MRAVDRFAGVPLGESSVGSNVSTSLLRFIEVSEAKGISKGASALLKT